MGLPADRSKPVIEAHRDERGFYQVRLPDGAVIAGDKATVRRIVGVQAYGSSIRFIERKAAK